MSNTVFFCSHYSMQILQKSIAIVLDWNAPDNSTLMCKNGTAYWNSIQTTDIYNDILPFIGDLFLNFVQK